MALLLFRMVAFCLARTLLDRTGRGQRISPSRARRGFIAPRGEGHATKPPAVSRNQPHPAHHPWVASSSRCVASTVIPASERDGGSPTPSGSSGHACGNSRPQRNSMITTPPRPRSGGLLGSSSCWSGGKGCGTGSSTTGRSSTPRPRSRRLISSMMNASSMVDHVRQRRTPGFNPLRLANIIPLRPAFPSL